MNTLLSDLRSIIIQYVYTVWTPGTIFTYTKSIWYTQWNSNLQTLDAALIILPSVGDKEQYKMLIVIFYGSLLLVLKFLFQWYYVCWWLYVWWKMKLSENISWAFTSLFPLFKNNIYLLQGPCTLQNTWISKRETKTKAQMSVEWIFYWTSFNFFLYWLV